MAAGRVKIFVLSQDWFYSVCGADHRNLQGDVVANCAEDRRDFFVRRPCALQDKFPRCLRFSSSSECANFLLCSRDGCPQCKLCRKRRDSTVQVQFLEVVDVPLWSTDWCRRRGRRRVVMAVAALKFFFGAFSAIFRTPSGWT